MTESEKMRRLARRRMEKADSALRAARALLDRALFEDAISRGYYAMFHSASALLFVRGLSTSKHRGVLSLFDKHFVKPGLLDVRLSEWIHGAFKARQEADYGYESAEPDAAAQETFEHAEAFVAAVQPVLESLLREIGCPPAAYPTDEGDDEGA